MKHKMLMAFNEAYYYSQTMDTKEMQDLNFSFNKLIIFMIYRCNIDHQDIDDMGLLGMMG